jgi:hypothetical protein
MFTLTLSFTDIILLVLVWLVALMLFVLAYSVFHKDKPKPAAQVIIKAKPVKPAKGKKHSLSDDPFYEKLFGGEKSE